MKFKPNGGGMPRRQFLTLTSAAIVGAATTDLPAQIVKDALGVDEPCPLLSVGYFGGDLAEPDGSGLIGADGLRSGDGSLAAGGAVLRVHGFRRGPARAAEEVSIGLNALYQVDGLAETAKVPFLAWSSASVAASRPFVVPVHQDTPLELTVTKRAPYRNGVPLQHDERLTSASKERSVVSLTVGSRRRSMKLRSGVYFIALRSNHAERTPYWPSIRLENVDGRPTLVQPGVAGYEPVPFDYVTLSVAKA